MIILYIILCLIVLEEFIEFLDKRTHRYKNSLGGADRLKKVPDGIEICNVGSGPGLYAISYNDCKLKGFNFSTAPQSFEYGFKILKHFSRQIKPNAIIIIIIMCPLSFGSNDAYKRRGYSDKFYGILPHSYIDNYSIVRHLKLAHPFMRKILKKMTGILRRPNPLKANEKNNELNIIRGWKRQFHLKDLKDPIQSINHEQAFNEKINLLNDEIQYCYSNGWRPTLVIPPVPEHIREHISREFVNVFVFKNIEKVIENNKDLRCFSYYDDSRFSEEMFWNDVFMNEEGRAKFSSILFNDLEV